MNPSTTSLAWRSRRVIFERTFGSRYCLTLRLCSWPLLMSDYSGPNWPAENKESIAAACPLKAENASATACPLECGDKPRRGAFAALDRACAQHLATVPAKAVSPSCSAEATQDSATALQRLRVFVALSHSAIRNPQSISQPPRWWRGWLLWRWPLRGLSPAASRPACPRCSLRRRR